jgi:hypothetical protein
VAELKKEKLQQFCNSATSQRGMFREISQPEALLGALVFPKNFSS